MNIDALSELAEKQGIPSLRPTISGTSHVVSAGHYLATQAAHNILEAGGNAIDAGVCAGLVLGVVQCDVVNIAGVAPIILYLAETKEVLTISGLGWWPRAVDPQLFVREHGGLIPEGLLRTVVPAAPAAWIMALGKYGTMSFGEVAASAIGFARDGFVMYPLMAEIIETYVSAYERYPSTAEIFLPGGRLPKVGDRFKQTDLANSLQYMVDRETTAAGGGRLAGLKAARDAFYLGDIARRIVDFHEQNGGLLTMEDLAEFEVKIEPAISKTFGSSTIYSCGPWCQGPSLLQMMSILEGVDLKSMGHNSVAYVHMLTETIKLCFADRHHYIGDPRFRDVPLSMLLDPDYCTERRAMIAPDRAWSDMPPPGRATVGLATQSPAPPILPPLDTSYVAVIDRHGNAFSATPSDVSFESPIIPGTGLCPSARGGQSWADPQHASSVSPGKRPRLTPAPFLARRQDGTVTAFGTPGGDVQLQALLQVWMNIEVFGMTPQAAVEAPRFASYSFPDSFEPHATSPGLLSVEGRLGSEKINALKALGHDVSIWPDFAWRAGAVCYATKQQTGLVFASADPRRPCYALGR